MDAALGAVSPGPSGPRHGIRYGDGTSLAEYAAFGAAYPEPSGPLSASGSDPTTDGPPRGVRPVRVEKSGGRRVVLGGEGDDRTELFASEADPRTGRVDQDAGEPGIL